MSPTARRALRASGIVAGTMVIAAAVAAAVTPIDPDPTADGHGYRGMYFRDLLFLGEPMEQPAARVRFDWRRGSPFPEGRPRDRFSARWDTCLDVRAPVSIEAKIASDDGSRLFIDGELVVDDWGDHGMRELSAVRPLARGSHHVEIEYYDMSRDARIEAQLALTTEPGGPVPRQWLRIPTRARSAPDVCAR